MGAHQLEPAGPVEVDLEGVTDRGRAVGEGSSSWAISPATLRAPRTVHDPAVAGPDDEAAIRRLAATARVENGAIEHHER